MKSFEPIIYNKSSEDMIEIKNNQVDLVITSPPYRALIDYDGYDDGQGYEIYINMINNVLSECYRVMRNGARICINIANIGRKPYKPMDHLITELLLKNNFHLRGQIIWQKWDNATTTAWGSYNSPSNPALRDVHEYIIIASKGKESLKNIYNGINTISHDEFINWTNSIWKILPRNDKNHPAVFPLEIPKRLMHLYTWTRGLVLDPFAGSGTTLEIARYHNRRSIGYEISKNYSSYIKLKIESGRQISLDDFNDFWSDQFIHS